MAQSRKGITLWQATFAALHQQYLGSLLALLLLAELIFLFFFRQVNLDEGWYLWASKLVYEGKLLYRDFAYTQTPVLPYVYGLFQRLFGEGLYQGRALTLGLSLVTFGLSAATAQRLAGPWGALFCLALLATAFFALAQFTYTATYALTAFLFAAALYVSLSNRPESQRNLWAALLLVTAIGVRLSVVAALPPFLLYLVLSSQRRFSAGVQVMVATTAWLVLLLGLFWWLSGDNMIYDILGFHTDRLLRTDWHLLRIDYVVRKTSEDFIGLIGLCVAGAGVGVVQLWRGRRSPASPHPREGWLLIALFGMTMALFVVHLIPRTTDSYYNALQAPLMSVSGGIVLARWLQGESRGRRRLIGLLIGLVILTHGVRQLQAFLRDGFLLFPLRNRIEIVRSAADLLRSYTKANDPLLSFSPHLALEAGLRVPPGYEMAIFAYRPTWSNAEVVQYHVVNNERLLRDLTSARAAAVALTQFDFEQLYGEREAVQTILQDRYRWFATVAGFGPYGDDLQLYLPPQFGEPTTQVALRVALDEGITLLGFDLARRTVRQEEQLHLALQWHAVRKPSRDYTVFVQLLDRAGVLAVGWDNQPCRNTCPTTSWHTGEFIRDEYTLSLAPLQRGEVYTLQVGLYDPATQQRLSVYDQEGEPVGDSIVLTTVQSERK